LPNPHADQRFHPCIRRCSRNPTAAPKKNPQISRQMILRIQPVESSAHVLTSPCRDVSLASPAPRKLKAQHRKTKTVQAFMVWKHFVMQRPQTAMRMQTTAACVAFSAPAFSSASSRPAGPSRKQRSNRVFVQSRPSDLHEVRS